MDAKLDIILFGVSGFVGRYALKHLRTLCAENNLSWGVAGRDVHKIRKILRKENLCENTQVIIADMDDNISIQKMTKKARLILNACGPLRNKGEVVIEACLRSKTHYIDVSAEPNFIEKLKLEYEKSARDSGIFIVNSCGVDSLLYDSGVNFLKKYFKNDSLNSVETYYKVGFHDKPIPGAHFNNSTWKSAIDLTANWSELKKIRKKLNYNLPSFKPKLKTRWMPFKTSLEDGWAFPSITADLSIMKRTQQFFYEVKKSRPVQLQNYIMFADFMELIVCILSIFIFGVLSNFEFGRNLLLKYPEVFSVGLFGKDEPPIEKIENSFLRLTFVGKGWDAAGKSKEIHVRFSGNNPAYNLTGLALVVSGITLLKEFEKMPNFGVHTPGAAFHDTKIIEKLQNNGVEIEISN